MAGLLKTVKNLCNSARLFLALAVLSIMAQFLFRIYNPGFFNGLPTPANLVIYSAIAVGYTYVLNRTCKSGYKTISWILALIPLLGLVSFAGKTLLGMIGEELISIGEVEQRALPVSVIAINQLQVR